MIAGVIGAAAVAAVAGQVQALAEKRKRKFVLEQVHYPIYVGPTWTCEYCTSVAPTDRYRCDSCGAPRHSC